MGELKTKPTQHSVKGLQELGIQPDILLCRAEVPLPEGLKNKISLFTNVEEGAVISAYNVKNTIYEIPVLYHEQGIDKIILKKLGLDPESRNKKIAGWEKTVKAYIASEKKVRIGIVGKYLELHDSYKSIFEALQHAGIALQNRVELVKFDSEKIEADADPLSGQVDGVLVPGGFGERGIEGMVRAAEIARSKGIPYFGICLGLQIMVIEFARHVLGLREANSTEFAPQGPDPVVSLLEEQENVKVMGASIAPRLESFLSQGGDENQGRLPGARDPRASPPPFRGFEPVPLLPRTGGACHERDDRWRSARGERRVEGPSLGYRGAVSPGVQVQAHRSPPSVSKLRRGMRPPCVTFGAFRLFSYFRLYACSRAVLSITRKARKARSSPRRSRTSCSMISCTPP